MRTTLDKKHNTKSERIFGRLLQELHIPFRTKVQISGHEVDFLIERYAVEIDGHSQATQKNEQLASIGYIPLHFSNQEIYNDRENIKLKLKQLKCQ